MQNRFPDAGEPMHIAMQFSVPDEIVPMETGSMLTRTLGVPLIGTVQLPAPYIDEIPYENTPISLNHASGKTAGALQVHWIHKMNNLEEWRATSHASSPDSLERSEEHTSELQSRGHLVCRLLLEKKKLRA